jgi:hypothetical protein
MIGVASSLKRLQIRARARARARARGRKINAF